MALVEAHRQVEGTIRPPSCDRHCERSPDARGAGLPSGAAAVAPRGDISVDIGATQRPMTPVAPGENYAFAGCFDRALLRTRTADPLLTIEVGVSRRLATMRDSSCKYESFHGMIRPVKTYLDANRWIVWALIGRRAAGVTM
jgi:hypothetical protein